MFCTGKNRTGMEKQKGGVCVKYKIGEVSKILNIPVETIRFYETKKLIHPQKDKSSNYRYYDVWDINRLLDYRKYRELEFSLKDSLEIIESASLEGVTDKLQEKINEAEKKMELYQLKMLKLQNYRNVLKNIPLIIGEYPIVKRPAGYYYINRWYRGGDIRYGRADESGGRFEELLSHYTFVENIYRIRKEWFESDRETEEFEWGFTIKKKWADALDIQMDEKMEYIEPVQSIYTILKAREKEYFSHKMLGGVFDFMEKQGYRLAGDILGNQIASVREGDEDVRYMEIWVPVTSDCGDSLL